MYLLILLIRGGVSNEVAGFTSHYVSINSTWQEMTYAAARNLHPTMYLLIPIEGYMPIAVI